MNGTLVWVVIVVIMLKMSSIEHYWTHSHSILFIIGPWGGIRMAARIWNYDAFLFWFPDEKWKFDCHFDESVWLAWLLCFDGKFQHSHPILFIIGPWGCIRMATRIWNYDVQSMLMRYIAPSSSKFNPKTFDDFSLCF